MNFKPILFSGPMVLAILDGRKTQTRRLCKDNGDSLIGYQYVTDNPTYPEMWKGKKAEPYTGWIAKFSNLPIAMPRACPYGQIGDVLWVRESFLQGQEMDENDSFRTDENDDLIPKIWYKATDPDLRWFTGESDFPAEKAPWKPSIHMPKSACRIFLQITDIEVQRIQDITEADCLSEGVKVGAYPNDLPARAFVDLWMNINGEKSWTANPWVWVVSFKRIDKPENFIA